MDDQTTPDAAEEQAELPQPEVAEPVEAVDNDNPLSGLSLDDVVSALLQGKFSTDAAEQRRRLTEAGYDPEEVKEAVSRRLNQRYE